MLFILNFCYYIGAIVLFHTPLDIPSLKHNSSNLTTKPYGVPNPPALIKSYDLITEAISISISNNRFEISSDWILYNGLSKSVLNLL